MVVLIRDVGTLTATDGTDSEISLRITNMSECRRTQALEHSRA